MRYFFFLLLFLPGAIQVIGQTIVPQDTLGSSRAPDGRTDRL
jgi:hypothetical protein